MEYEQSFPCKTKLNTVRHNIMVTDLYNELLEDPSTFRQVHFLFKGIHIHFISNKFSSKVILSNANSTDPDQTKHFVVFALGLYCLPRYF